jgi:magnesium-dependent phosphatase 1
MQAVRIGKAAMGILEVLPGVTLKDAFLTAGGGFGDERNLQIGRSAPLSSNKSETHFPILREGTGVPYDQMLFFDDCNWSDHCSIVERVCQGVVTQRTPQGMTTAEWEEGMRKFAEEGG